MTRRSILDNVKVRTPHNLQRSMGNIEVGTPYDPQLSKGQYKNMNSIRMGQCKVRTPCHTQLSIRQYRRKNVRTPCDPQLSMGQSFVSFRHLVSGKIFESEEYVLNSDLQNTIKTSEIYGTYEAFSLVQCSAIAKQHNHRGFSYNDLSKTCLTYLDCLKKGNDSSVTAHGWQTYCQKILKVLSRCHYKVLDTTMTWLVAKNDCIEKNGYLLEVNTKEESDFVEMNVIGTGACTYPFWLGGSKNNGVVTWSTSELNVPIPPEVGYSNWGDGLPQLDVQGFDCLLWTPVGWKIYTCNEPKCTICEADECIF
ncbi:uncharacterized protein LOC133204097 [Saccostrea echinata]|uniref:uncharacterized protein LOC133204097 n=1 Tax=Saccostrea echinata TaxID=191078 RepID=UPI002A82C263|nr:uncharacterized protein LOC133204097 [Saccostrea echinata]